MVAIYELGNWWKPEGYGLRKERPICQVCLSLDTESLRLSRNENDCFRYTESLMTRDSRALRIASWLAQQVVENKVRGISEC